MAIEFTRAGVARGALMTLPLGIGLLPFGLVVGVLADAKGLSLLETVLMSALVFAGSAQLLALGGWAEPAPVFAAAVAALVLNIRLAPMGAALAPWLDRLRGVRLWGTLALLVDNSFALAVAEMRAGRRDAAVLVGLGLGLWGQWLVTTGAGHALGSVVRLAPGHWLFFAAVATVVAILMPLWRGVRSDLLPWTVAALVAGGAHLGLGLGPPWPLLLGAFAGAAVGAARDTGRAA